MRKAWDLAVAVGVVAILMATYWVAPEHTWNT